MGFIVGLAIGFVLGRLWVSYLRDLIDRGLRVLGDRLRRRLP